MRAAWAGMLLWACSGRDAEDKGPTAPTGDTGDSPTVADDADQDGHPAGVDCDDADPLVHPGAEELCDGRDSDCDAATAEPTGAVAASGVGAFATIGEAIASAPPGGTVWVCGGTWTELLVIEQDLQLVGIGGPTIDAGGLGAGIEITGGTVRIEGFTVQNGAGSATGPRTVNGGGINAYGATGPVEIVGCTVTGGLAELAGGVLFGPEGGALVDSVIEGNVAGEHGGGVYAAGDLTISGTTFRDNVAASYGGGLAVGDSNVVSISGSTFEGNSAGSGGGIFSFENGRLELDATVVSDNRADIAGGGVYLWDAELVGGEIADNSAESGGGVYVYAGADLEGTVIRGNGATTGGGIWMRDAVDLVGVTVEQNTAPDGAGVYVYEAEVVADDATVVRQNVATTRGGGGLMVDASWTGGTIAENEAPEGGGLYVSGSGTGSTTLAAAELSDNVALVSGAGVFLGGPYEIADVSFLRNLSFDRGGGLYSTFGAVGTVDGATISSNTASQRGGGVYVNDGSVMTVSASTLDKNVALRGAGVYVYGDSTITLSDSVVEANGDSTTVSGGGVRVTDGLLVSSMSDWGDASLLSDNLPDDVYVEESQTAYLGYTLDETYTCDVFTCSPAP